MEAVLDAHAQMASFFSPLRKANCMNSGLCTPPWSPELDGFRKRNGPGLHLSKFLRIGDKHSSRRSRRATNGTTPPGPCAECVSKSPFRAVTEMKEPFPLMLPDSPALTDKSSHDEEKQRLRRISASYMDLRALAQVQTLPSTSRLNTPLLPSPMFIPGEGNTEAGSCFAYPKRRDTPLPCEEEEKDVPYEVQHRIISGYCTKERWSLLLDEVRQSKQASQLRHASSPWKQNQTSSTSPQPLKPSPKQGKRDRTCSTESDWFANTMSHEARVRRFKQRCFQVVQHPTDLIVARKDNEDQIMLATVLVGPGKPKLVEIQRPSFGSRSSRSTASQAGTMTEEEEEEEEEENRPSTPVQGQNEVSAFSPYDTPCRRTFGAMIPVMQLVNSSDSVQKLRPAPLTVTPCSTRHPRVDSAVYVHENKAENHPVASNDSQHTLNSYTSSVAWPIPRRPTTRSKSDSRLRQRKLETALDMITSAIDLFPSSLLHLESPTVRQLRNTHISSHIYVIPLQKIFPTASPLLLSAMAAWCLVDVYLGSHEVQRDTLSAEERYHDICAASNESLHKIPDKARRMLGIRSPEENGWESQERRLKQRSQFVRISVGVIAQRLMEAVRGGWVEELWRAVGVIVQAVDAGGYEVGEEEEEEEEEEEWL